MIFLRYFILGKGQKNIEASKILYTVVSTAIKYGRTDLFLDQRRFII